ncbi:MAG: hypothetical protein GY761_06830, partial [Hyphomicrobiales bacterium]|nr:hypothetical protein [Hyphomicrobiales bacterium]
SFFSNSIGLVSTASADETVIDSQNSASKNSGKQVSDRDQLRGIIDHAADNPIIGFRVGKSTLPVSDIRTEKRDPAEIAVTLDTPELLIDQVVTGQSSRSMLFQKFDSNGSPMSHHQEYTRPNARSLTSGIWNAINLNPYPGE